MDAKEVAQAVENVAQSGILVVVEGLKDKRALNILGFENILVLHKKPLFQVIESIAQFNETVVILTDLDREGKKLYAALSSGLRKNGVKVDNKLRQLLMKHKISHIEGLATFIQHHDEG